MHDYGQTAWVGTVMLERGFEDGTPGRAYERFTRQGPAAFVRSGNAAQTLHPVAGQRLNLGLRGAHELVAALRDAVDLEGALKHVEWSRAPDPWGMFVATDFLARSFTWSGPAWPRCAPPGWPRLRACRR